MYDSNTLADVLGNFVCMAIWGSVKGCSALSCQSLLFFLVGLRSDVPSIIRSFFPLLSFSSIFPWTFARTLDCIWAGRASRIFFRCFPFYSCRLRLRLRLQSWSRGREEERLRARFWQCSSSTSFSDKYSWSGAAFLHGWNIYAGEMRTDEILLLRYFEILQLRKLYVST